MGGGEGVRKGLSPPYKPSPAEVPEVGISREGQCHIPGWGLVEAVPSEQPQTFLLYL